MNVDIGTEAAQSHFFSGNICFEFSVLCCCSEETTNTVLEANSWSNIQRRHYLWLYLFFTLLWPTGCRKVFIYILERDAGGERVQIRTAKPILPNFNGNAAGSGGKTCRLLFALQSRNGILDWHFWEKLKPSQTGIFVWFSIPLFPFYSVLFINRLEFFCFVAFFLLKSEESTVSCENPPVEGTVLQIALSTLMSKNSISDPQFFH